MSDRVGGQRFHAVVLLVQVSVVKGAVIRLNNRSSDSGLTTQTHSDTVIYGSNSAYIHNVQFDILLLLLL